jgi:putative SbcD/Mre11-related phosphoesterase
LIRESAHKISPIFNAPLLLVERDLSVLVAADIHLGLEFELWQCGISIPSQTQRLQERLKGYIKEIEPNRLVLLGDVKHNVPRTSWQERKEVPSFLRSVSADVDVDIVIGNHDVGLASMAPQGTRVIPAQGYELDGIGYFHGHTWPDPKIFSADLLVAGHIHPAIGLRDPLRHSFSKPAWIRAPLSSASIEAQYESSLPNPDLIIVPAFNDLCGGLPLNEPKEDERGPVLTLADLERARIYLLDGTDLGSLGAIRAKEQNQERGRKT